MFTISAATGTQSSDPLTPFFFTGFFRVLYWIIFSPSHYFSYVHILVDRDGANSVQRYLILLARSLIVFLLFCWLLTAITILALEMAASISRLTDFDLIFILVKASLSLVVSATVGGGIILFSIISNKGKNLSDSIALGTLVVPLISPLFGFVNAGSDNLVLLSLGCGFVVTTIIGSINGVAYGSLLSTSAPLFFITLNLLGLAPNRPLDPLIVSVSVGWIIGALRIPLYLIELCVSLIPPLNDAKIALGRSPIMWNEMTLFPQFGFERALHAALDEDFSDSVYQCAQVLKRYHRYNDNLFPVVIWQIRQALHTWFITRPNQVYSALDVLCRNHYTYVADFTLEEDYPRKVDSDYVLALIFTNWPNHTGSVDRIRWLIGRLVSPLVRTVPTTPQHILEVYFELTTKGNWTTAYLTAFEQYRQVRFGEEIYQIFRTLDDYLKKTSFGDLVDADSKAMWIQQLDSRLQEDTLAAIAELARVGTNVRNYFSFTSEAGTRDAINRAVYAAEFALRTTDALKLPEHKLVRQVAQQWLRLTVAEQAKLIVPSKVDRIPNKYLIGRPIYPDTDHPFVGRIDQIKAIKDNWMDATLKAPIILYGQRRMGKTSILLHLEKSLGESCIAIFINLQTLAAVESTGAFVYNFCDVVYRRLRNAGIVLDKPEQKDFVTEPFIELRRFLDNIEDHIGSESWVVFMLDEFEMIETKIKEKKIEQDLLYQLRDIMLNRPHFAVVLAGAHTLDEMSRDYWSPLFSGIHNVKVSYLDEAAAETLITNPWDGFQLEYDRNAVQAIINVTGCQPTLLQSLGSALLDHINARLEKEGPQYYPRVTLRDVEEGLNEIQKTSTYFDAVWKELDENERRVLTALAKAQPAWNQFASRDTVNRKLSGQLPSAQINSAWEKLETRDMIDLTDTGVKFHVELVRRWVTKNKAASQPSSR
jgi:hypothetical protein